MSESQLATAPVTPGFHKATSALSEFLGIEPRMMVETLKKQCFLSMKSEDVSDAQLAAFISVANALELNPMVPGMLYAYPGKNGAMIPVTGPDGVFKMLDERIGKGLLDGFECTVFPEVPTGPVDKPTHAIATIWRKNSEHPSRFTAYFSEWYLDSNPNWKTRPRHMLWLRAIKQCARQVIHGIPFDEDEVVMGDMKNVMPEDAPKAPRAEAPKKSAKGAAAVKENAAIDVTSTTAATAPAPASEPKDVTPPPAPAETPAPAAQEPAPAEKPAPAPAEAPKPAAAPKAPRAKNVVQRSSLQDKEVTQVTVTVYEFKTLEITKEGKVHQSVTAQVSGPEFKGNVFHLGGSKLVGDKREADEAWQLDKPVLLTLRGEFSAKQNRVVTWVEKIELPGATAASQQAAVDV